MRCKLCGSEKYSIIHRGVRDDENIDVLKCSSCGLVSLSKRSQINDNFYEVGSMHDDADASFDDWRNETEIDDLRRCNYFDSILPQESILDFGCGNGGFLNLLKEKTNNVYGVELETSARERIEAEGIIVKKSINDYRSQRFDNITMFHVIEHLTEPENELQQIKEYLNTKGRLLIETPNADDALLSLYNSQAFFTRRTIDFCQLFPIIYIYTNI